MKRLPLSRGDWAILSTNLLWGTFWIPLRQMTAAGGGETEATLWGYLAAGVLMVPILLVRWRSIFSMPRLALVGVIVLAICLALYSESLTRGQVARVLLLFYLTPIWSMIFAHFLLGEPISLVHMIAIVLGWGWIVVCLCRGRERNGWGSYPAFYGDSLRRYLISRNGVRRTGQLKFNRRLCC